MSVTKKILSGVAFAAAMALGVSSASAQGAEFDGTNFTCLQYTSATAENSSTKAQSNLAKLWVSGYLSGYYKAQGKLDVTGDAASADKLNAELASKCKEFPSATIWALASKLAEGSRTMPVKQENVDVATYTCAMHTDAKAGSAADMMKAELADLWAFAFIQGYKNFTDKEMVINMENKPLLTGAVTRTCGKMRDKTFLDLTGMVAQAVKLGGQ